MENISTLNAPAAPSNSNVCINCGNPDILKDKPNALCNTCREHFIKFPIPSWVRIFGGGIIAVVIFSLFTFPSNLSNGIAMERGIQAEKEKKYLSAQHYFENVIRNVPDNIEAKAHLLIASFYNNDLNTFARMADTLGGKTIDDDELLNEVQKLMDKGSNYFPSDSFVSLEKKYGATDSIPDAAFADFIKEHNEELFPKILYASALYDHKAYTVADSVLNDILTSDNGNINALGMMGSLKRLENELEESLKYCDQLLNINHESTYGLSSKARTLLKMKRNEDGLKLARESIQIDSADGYGRATLALAYHFNNLIRERDELINKTTRSKDSAAIGYFQFVLDVISNKDHL